MYRFQLTSTQRDLLDAEEAERLAILRRPFRWAMIVLGSGWLVMGLFDLMAKPSWLPIVWIVLGLAILYYFIGKPYQRRARIRRPTAASQHVSLQFGDAGLNLEISDVGEFKRRWDEVVGIVDADKGVLFHFSDGMMNWLPNRVFKTMLERTTFVDYVRGANRRVSTRDCTDGD